MLDAKELHIRLFESFRFCGMEKDKADFFARHAVRETALMEVGAPRVDYGQVRVA